MINTDQLRQSYPDDPMVKEFADLFDRFAPIIEALAYSAPLKAVLQDNRNYGVKEVICTWAGTTHAPETLHLELDILIKHVWGKYLP